jgi:hypothetical protein
MQGSCPASAGTRAGLRAGDDARSRSSSPRAPAPPGQRKSARSARCGSGGRAAPILPDRAGRAASPASAFQTVPRRETAGSPCCDERHRILVPPAALRRASRRTCPEGFSRPTGKGVAVGRQSTRRRSCWRFDQRFDLASMVERLGAAAVADTPPIPYRLVRLAGSLVIRKQKRRLAPHPFGAMPEKRSAHRRGRGRRDCGDAVRFKPPAVPDRGSRQHPTPIVTQNRGRVLKILPACGANFATTRVCLGRT